MVDPDNAYRPDLAIPPGETLKETIDALGITQVELARRMGRPLKTVNEIINGKAMITSETALQLELVVGIPAVFWTNLERNYQLTKARLAEDQRLATEIELARRYPYRDLVLHGCVQPAQRPLERVRELLKFLGVNSLTAVELPDCALRIAVRSRPSQESLAAWLRMGELACRAEAVQPYDQGLLSSMIPEFRNLTIGDSADWPGRLRSRCAEAGVAVAFVPHLPGTFAHGATRWIAPTKALVQLSLRYRYADIFWFTFFHELGHILKHGKREVFIEVERPSENPKEAEANEFAARVLIPDAQYAQLVHVGSFDERSIRLFASAIGIHQGIVVGRLQRDDHLDHSALNHLRMKLKFASE
jgi:HTH-type transcriptional regulator/antitoxin HigA